MRKIRFIREYALSLLYAIGWEAPMHNYVQKNYDNLASTKKILLAQIEKSEEIKKKTEQEMSFKRSKNRVLAEKGMPVTDSKNDTAFYNSLAFALGQLKGQLKFLNSEMDKAHNDFFRDYGWDLRKDCKISLPPYEAKTI